MKLFRFFLAETKAPAPTTVVAQLAALKLAELPAVPEKTGFTEVQLPLSSNGAHLRVRVPHWIDPVEVAEYIEVHHGTGTGAELTYVELDAEERAIVAAGWDDYTSRCRAAWELRQEEHRQQTALRVLESMVAPTPPALPAPRREVLESFVQLPKHQGLMRARPVARTSGYSPHELASL